ncbi:aspartate kinase [Sinorhizobium meliloti]|uniref:amino acid kinase family protein n=1 Tax=Rhizobium meliloti TaxID=382 RepID=UPI00129517D0|nr:aspartate kinase [Sinorhizobium meliloti]MQW64013.1 aspartate kinase [Sinorhizobium meliloti]
MRPVIKGFPDYGVSVVVKFGGSLMKNLQSCKDALAELEDLHRSGHRILIVPGGGLPDKAIESVNATHPFEHFTAHHACALAQDQTGYMLADAALSFGLVATSSLGECRQILNEDRIPVLLPSRILFALDPVEWSWDVTSDAVAAWVAWLCGAQRLAIWTDVDGVFRDGATHDTDALIREITSKKLACLGHTSIDMCAAQFMAARNLAGAVLNGAFPDRMRAWLEGNNFVGTRIIAS